VEYGRLFVRTIEGAASVFVEPHARERHIVGNGRWQLDDYDAVSKERKLDQQVYPERYAQALKPRTRLWLVWAIGHPALVRPILSGRRGRRCL
jgi:hypothetical protein